MEGKVDLYAFFEGEGLVDTFYQAAINSRPRNDMGCARSTIDYLADEYNDDAINSCMGWSGTAEGHSFWRDLHAKLKVFPRPAPTYNVRLSF